MATSSTRFLCLRTDLMASKRFRNANVAISSKIEGKMGTTAILLSAMMARTLLVLRDGGQSTMRR